MLTTKMSASFLTLILIVLIQGNSEAAPARKYDGIPSGALHPISGVVPVSVQRTRPAATNQILKAIRARVDKSQASVLNSSVRNDILKDALVPAKCMEKYGVGDDILKHTIHGARDIVGAVIKDFQGLGEGILKDLPLVPHVINGIGEAITFVVCGVENAASEVISGFDDAPDILTKVLVDLIEFQGSAPLANVPAAILNITELIGQVGVKVARDLVIGIDEGVDDLAIEVESGVKEVVDDVTELVSGVETKVSDVVNAVADAAAKIGDGVESGVGDIVGGITDVVSEVDTKVSDVVNAVADAAAKIGGGVGTGVGDIVGGIRGGLAELIHAL